MWLPLTCQAAVYEVMFLPKPENGLVWGFHGIHGLFSHFLKVLAALLTPKEGVNVPPDGLQHCLWVVFKACGGADTVGAVGRGSSTCLTVCTGPTGRGGVGGQAQAECLTGQEQTVCSQTQEGASTFPEACCEQGLQPGGTYARVQLQEARQPRGSSTTLRTLGTSGTAHQALTPVQFLPHKQPPKAGARATAAAPLICGCSASKSLQNTSPSVSTALARVSGLAASSLRSS